MHFDTDWILERAAELAAVVRRHRRTIHREPELGFAEHRTAAYIESVLDRLNVPHRRVVGTGVVGVVHGHGDRAVGVRADMDALPVTEAAGRTGYRSQVEGVSHACGHDGHVAVVLGLAELLCTAPDLPGSVALYFQPAEEGPGGAAPMVAAGVLDDPVPRAVLALHTSSRHHSGTIAVRPGPLSASDDTVTVVIEGTGGHAAHPDTAVDPIPIAAQVVMAVQQLVTREVDPAEPAVVTFGRIGGGTRHNVIATSVELVGTIRTVHPHNRELLVRRIPELARGIAEAHRASAIVRMEPGYGVGTNDAALNDTVRAAAVAVVGPDRVIDEPAPSLGGEDFFAFGDTGIPVHMHRLGVANPERGITAPHHAPDFDLDETALPTGVAVFAETIRRLLT